MNDFAENFSIEDIKIDTFPAKTYHMVESCDRRHPHVACWTKEGDAFVVKDSSFLSASYIPKYFKHSNFQSFVRQLNLYGFRSSKPKEDESSGNDSSDGGGAVHTVFRHENFRKGQKNLLSNIQRSKTGDKSHRKKLRDDGFLQDISNSLQKIDRVEDDVSSLHEKIDDLTLKLDRVITLLSLDRISKLNAALSGALSAQNNPNFKQQHQHQQSKSVAFEGTNHSRRIKRQRSEYGMDNSSKSNLDLRKTTELLKRSFSVPSIFKGTQRNNGVDLYTSSSQSSLQQHNQTLSALLDNTNMPPMAADEKALMNAMMDADAVSSYDPNELGFTGVKTSTANDTKTPVPADIEVISDAALEQVVLKDSDHSLNYTEHDDRVNTEVDTEPIPLDDMMQMDFGNLVKEMEEGFADDVETSSRRPKKFMGGAMSAAMTGCMLAVVAALAVTSTSLAVGLSRTPQSNSSPSSTGTTSFPDTDTNQFPVNEGPQNAPPEDFFDDPQPEESPKTDSVPDPQLEDAPETDNSRGDSSQRVDEPLQDEEPTSEKKPKTENKKPDNIMYPTNKQIAKEETPFPSASPTVHVKRSLTLSYSPRQDFPSLVPSISLVPTPAPLN